MLYEKQILYIHLKGKLQWENSCNRWQIKCNIFTMKDYFKSRMKIDINRKFIKEETKMTTNVFLK